MVTIVLGIISAIAYLGLPDERKHVDEYQLYMTGKVFQDSFKEILWTLPFGCVSYGYMEILNYLMEQLNLDPNIVTLTMASFIAGTAGASIFFGWGFDARPYAMYAIWCIFASLSGVGYALSLYGYFNTMVIWVVFFMASTVAGFQVLLTAHLSNIHEDQLTATMSAWVAMQALCQLIAQMCVRLAVSNAVHLLYLAVFIVIAIVITCSKKMYSSY